MLNVAVCVSLYPDLNMGDVATKYTGSVHSNKAGARFILYLTYFKGSYLKLLVIKYNHIIK
jgi:hypothetical protein